MSKLVVKSSRAPVVTDVTNLANVEILPPEPPRKPLSAKTVKRILERAIEESALEDRYAELLRWDVLPNGTTVGVVEDTDTSVHYHYTICPKSFEPLNLGPIDD